MQSSVRRSVIKFSPLPLLLVVMLSACGGGGGGGASDDASLSSLTVSGITLDQIFQSSQKEYTASANFLIASFTVSAVPSDVNASVSVNGSAVDAGNDTLTVSLAEGDNIIDVVVTAEDGSTDTYRLTVTRATAASFAQQAYLKASNADSGDKFAKSVAISGDTLVVGADREDSDGSAEGNNSASNAGAAYVFTRSGTSWTQQAYLKASNADSGDLFGWSVAISDNTLVVGAIGEASSAAGDQANNSAAFTGAAYVFTRSGTTWSQQAYLKASNANAVDNFGTSVAISGDTLVVGAIEEDSDGTSEGDNSANNAGAAYVFSRSGTTWTQQAYLKASNADAGDRFGTSVAISGDTLVVGASGEDSRATGGEADDSAGGAGAAYVFTRNGTTWSQQAYLKASNAESSDSFGFSVAISGDTLVVGAIGEDSSVSGGEADDSAGGAGAAYVFTRNGSTWSQQAYLKASNAETNDRFGTGVAISGDTLVVGAEWEDSSASGGEADNSTNDAGAAYLFTRSGATWTQPIYLKASNAGDVDFFGSGVAISGDTLVVGSIGEDSSVSGGEADNSADDAGAIYTWQ